MSGQVDTTQPHVTGYGSIEPYTWKAIAATAATALAQIAVDLRRMADHIETVGA